MKRLIGLIALTTVTTAAFAQAPFTIVRPADGSKVREKVKILVPKHSIPKGGYVGVFVGGKFLEATKLPLVGRYYEYILDTKGKGVPDGPVNLEVVLYVDYNGEPRIVDRSSVDVTVANKANIPIPAGGFKLRYHFDSGDEMVYTLMQRVSLSALTPQQARLGARAAQLPLDFEKIRLLYSVDNAYGNGDGLVRMQPIPLKGKDYLYVTPQGASKPRVFDEHDVYPIYMRLSSTGTEVFGSVPAFVPFEGMRPPQNITSLMATYPLPTFPREGVVPGDVWSTRFQMGEINVDNVHNQTSVIESIPARGEFASIEWEMGHPCAKVVHKLELAQGGVQKLSLEEVIYYALDLKKVVKVIRTYYQDERSTVQSNAPAAPQNRGAGNGGTGTSLRAPGRTGGPRGSAGARGNTPPPPPAETTRQNRPRGSSGPGGAGGFQGPAGRENPMGGPGGAAGPGGARNQPAQGGGGRAPAIFRLTVQQIFVLEQ